ncbi:MAG: hypothetical protein WAX14_20350 [Rhodococcus sp. (in: high G+C Gram-positive bacteria)]|uniref:hypothetical protein n=1 Tax=Rhodococcus sp. TaxID=1831 RepID=UPI003BB732C4
MNLLTHTLSSLWQVVLVGLIFGAGLPALFALGMRSLASGGTDDSSRPTPFGMFGAVVCFTVVVIAIIAGILLLTADFLSSSLGITLF